MTNTRSAAGPDDPGSGDVLVRGDAVSRVSNLLAMGCNRVLGPEDHRAQSGLVVQYVPADLPVGDRVVISLNVPERSSLPPAQQSLAPSSEERRWFAENTLQRVEALFEEFGPAHGMRAHRDPDHPVVVVDYS